MVDLDTFFSFIQASAVVVAVIFGIVQVQQFRRAHEREAAFDLVHSLQTPEMLSALRLLDALSMDLSVEEIEERVGADADRIQILMGTWESLGILVYRREVSLDLVDDFYSGSIIHSWLKLRPLVFDLRERTGRATRWEFFQWLAERMLEREEKAPPVPAYLAHANWKPKSVSR